MAKETVKAAPKKGAATDHKGETVNTSVRIPQELYKASVGYAENELHSFNDFVILALRERCQRKQMAQQDRILK